MRYNKISTFNKFREVRYLSSYGPLLDKFSTDNVINPLGVIVFLVFIRHISVICYLNFQIKVAK